MQKHLSFLGFTGLIPFLLLPFLISLEIVSFFEGVAFFNQYSAIILSFLGGIWWAKSQNESSKPIQSYIAILPSLISFIALVLLPTNIVVWVTLVGFLLALAYELKCLEAQQWYHSLRINLTTIVAGCHLMMLWLIYKPF